MLQLLRRHQSVLGDQPADLIRFAVRCLVNSARTRCTAWMSCCSTVFTATNRICGLLIASQIASASLASFLLLFTYGFTNCGAISRTLHPCACSCLAQWCAPPHHSMPISQPGSAVSSNTLSQLARVSFRRHTAFSWSPTPCT